MTKEEVIEQLKERYDAGQKDCLHFSPRYVEALKVAMMAIEENERLKVVISKMETTTDKVFEETISRWHDSDVDLRVFEYLGITEKEYGDWLTRSYK